MRTVTLAASDADPPGPVAVAVYVTDEAGLTGRDPEFCTPPRSGSILTAVAFFASHCSVADWPRSIVDGAARSVIAGAAGGGGAG